MSTLEQETSVVKAVPKDLYIGGSWRPAEGGATFDVEDPATGKTLCAVADASPADGMAAMDAAVAAQGEWAQYPARERGEILRRGYEALMDRQDELGLLMTLEMGKPLAEAKGEIAYAAEFFRWFAEEAVRIDGGYAPSANGQDRVIVMRQPVGPTILITPWNFPMAMGTRKVGPAIAAGCTVVLKPADLTPLSALAMTEMLEQAGLPAGVVNVVTTKDAGGVMEPLIRSGKARKLSFTGSTAVGKKLLEQASEKVLRTSMELGGNAPFLVFDDADLDAAVDGAMLAKMRNVGEACTAANRFYVHESVADDFARRLAGRMSASVVGRGTDDGVTVGPLVEGRAVEKVQGLLSDAVDKGARVVTGGEPTNGTGHFFTPTVLTDIPESAQMRRTEIFGPVAAISTFTSEDEVIAEANDTEYGLVSYVYTRDLARALRVSERLDSGMVGLNKGMVSNAAAPFGGVKQSGIGREGGRLGIEEFLEVKYVAVPAP
ncbi:MAG: NAD-dependent succinate-semialdehyde dehydrogenase [Streptosporangiales bacterium]